MLGNIQTKLKTYNLMPYYPPEGYMPADLERAWQQLISREVRRKKAISATIQEIKQGLQQEFSMLANTLTKKLDSITSQVTDLQGELEEQLNVLQNVLASVEKLEQVELPQVVESEFRCLEANIEDVEDTVYSADDLAFEIAQAKQALTKKCHFLENQIVARNITTLQPEQLEEFEAAFRHFAKETDNSLTKSEFKSCLQALGVALTDEEFERGFSETSRNKVFVNFEQFTNYMVSITEDRTSSDQLRSAFRTLAENKVTTLSPNRTVPTGSQQLSLSKPDQHFSVSELRQSFECLSELSLSSESSNGEAGYREEIENDKESSEHIAANNENEDREEPYVGVRKRSESFKGHDVHRDIIWRISDPKPVGQQAKNRLKNDQPIECTSEDTIHAEKCRIEAEEEKQIDFLMMKAIEELQESPAGSEDKDQMQHEEHQNERMNLTHSSSHSFEPLLKPTKAKGHENKQATTEVEDLSLVIEEFDDKDETRNGINFENIRERQKENGLQERSIRIQSPSLNIVHFSNSWKENHMFDNEGTRVEGILVKSTINVKVNLPGLDGSGEWSTAYLLFFVIALAGLLNLPIGYWILSIGGLALYGALSMPPQIQNER